MLNIKKNFQKIIINVSAYKFKGIYAQVFFALTALMLLTILVVGAFSYSTAVNALTSQISNQKINTLTQTRKIADNSLKELEKLFSSKSTDTHMLYAVQAPYSNDYSNINNVMESLMAIKNTNRLIYSIYLYMPADNMIYTTKDGRWVPEQFYDPVWKDIPKNNEGNCWVASRSITTFSQEKLQLFSLVLPMQTKNTMGGEKELLIVNISESEFSKFILNPNPMENEGDFVINQKGEVVCYWSGIGSDENDETMLKLIKQLSTINEDKTLNINLQGNKYLVSHVNSIYNEWQYISIIPENQVIKPIWRIGLFIILSGILWLIVGMIYILRVSLKIYEPIASIMGIVDDRNITSMNNLYKNEFDHLHSTFSELILANKKMSEKIQLSEDTLKEGFIKDLILGSVQATEDIDSKLNFYNINYPFEDFWVIIISIDQYGKLMMNDKFQSMTNDLWYLTIKNIAERLVYPDANGVVVRMDKSQFAMVINGDKSKLLLLSLLKNIKEEIKNTLEHTVTIAVSDSFRNLSEVDQTYSDALEVLKMRVTFGGDRVLIKEENQLLKQKAYVPLLSKSKKDMVIHNISEGNIDELNKMIEKTVASISKNGGHSPEFIYQFFFFILGEGISAVTERGWSISEIFGEELDLYKEMIKNENIHDMGEWLRSSLERMFHFVNEKKENKNKSIIDSVVEYLHANYDKNIYLSETAESVYLSTSYLSRQFKEHTGKGFTEYLTNLKLEKAKEMLKGSNFTINEIAEKLNFGNVNNFIRIFKRDEGVTPGHYRKKFIDDNLERR